MAEGEDKKECPKKECEKKNVKILEDFMDLDQDVMEEWDFLQCGLILLVIIKKENVNVEK